MSDKEEDVAPGERAGMAALFWVYALTVTGGLAFFIVIGLSHN